jgi:hypothetical protein
LFVPPPFGTAALLILDGLARDGPCDDKVDLFAAQNAALDESINLQLSEAGGQ